MTWADRGRDLPTDWTKRRAAVLREEPDCRIAYPDEWTTRHGVQRCAVVSTEVDHVGDPTDHSRANLRGACSPCHARRTREQAAAALRGMAGRARYPERKALGLL